MSGPKVVRIVTREEVETICRSLIASFEHAAAELKHCAERHDLWTKELEAAITDKRRALGKMFERERWIDIQKYAMSHFTGSMEVVTHFQLWALSPRVQNYELTLVPTVMQHRMWLKS